MESPVRHVSVTEQALRPSCTTDLVAVHAWASPYGPGLRLLTAHYEIFTTVWDRDLLLHIPAYMEASHRAYNRLLPEPIEAQVRSTAYLLATREQWEDFTSVFAADQAQVFLAIPQGAYCHNGTCVAYDLGLDRTLAVLGHEGWHQFTSRHFTYRLPSWLDEGLAMCFEAPCVPEGDPALNRARVHALHGCQTQGSCMALDQVVAVSPGEFLDAEESTLGFYSHAYALVWFLQNGHAGRYRPGLQAMLWDGLIGRWPLSPVDQLIAQDRNAPRTVDWNRKIALALFRHYIPEDLKVLQQQYLAFCQGLVTQ